MISLMAVALAAQQPALRQGLDPLAFLVGHCWRGEIQPGRQDTHCFELVYDGQHVRDRHEVTGGPSVYRGETLYSWDGAAGSVTYTYWNSQGGVSRGAMRPEPDRLDFGGETYRSPDGREVTYSTYWRRLGDDAYEAVTVSVQSPTGNRNVRYQIVDPVTVTSSRNADGSHVLVHEVQVDAPVDQVWQAISTAAGWISWAVPVAWGDGDVLETSYSPDARRNDPTTIRQQIEVSVPGRLLAFRTTKAPDGFPHFETFRRVSHLFEVEAIDDRRSRVRLTGSGYSDDDAGRQLIGLFREGNRVSLDRLRRRFASGPLDWSRERQIAAHGRSE